MYLTSFPLYHSMKKKKKRNMIVNGVEQETRYTETKATSSSVSKRAATSSN